MKILIVGGGRATSFLAAHLEARKHHVIIVSKDEVNCLRQAQAIGGTVVLGDGSDPAVLDDAGVEDCDIVLAGTDSDADNLVICQLARMRFAVPRAVAILNDPANQEPFAQIGIESFSTIETVVSLIEQRVAFDRIMEMAPAVGGAVSISELVLDAEAPSIGRSLAEMGLPKGALVAAVARRGRPIIPDGTTRFEADDRVLLISVNGSRGQALLLLAGRENS